MPKPKPDQIIRHEIVFGRSERELIETATTAYTFNRISNPLVALISDVSAVTLILSLIATYYGFKWDIGTKVFDSAAEAYEDFIPYYDSYLELAAPIGTGRGGLRVLLDALLPGSPFNTGL